VIRTECEVTLSDPDATNADLRRMGEVVLEAADRTEGLLDGLLVLALSQRGLQRDEPVDLAVLARKAAAHVAAEAAEIHVRVRVEAEPAPVRGDPMLLERMVANLAENAVRHNEPGGWVTIQTGSDGGEAVLRVENGGRPIPADAVERLADPFQRLARSAERRGSGLGLSIVRSVAEAHDGRLALAAGTEGGLCAEVALRRSAGVLMPA
jgi:signal transduction histidine kinase